MDNKTFWVDRFDHILTEEEFCEEEIMGFDDVENLSSGNNNPELFEQYVAIENRLIDFIVDITTSIQPNIAKVEYKVWKKRPMDFYLNKGLDKWKLESLVKMQSGDAGLEVETMKSIEEYRFYLELALREKVDLRVLIDKTVLTFGFDLKILFQCIDKVYLESYCEKHNLHILDEWYRTFWNE